MKTFVVRLFVPTEQSSGPGGVTLHGFVEESASGRSVGFQNGLELLRFLAAAAGGRRQPAGPSERRAS